MLAVGIFASLTVNFAGANGLITGDGAQLLKQVISIVAVVVTPFYDLGSRQGGRCHHWVESRQERRSNRLRYITAW
jgi:hypothetical protein